MKSSALIISYALFPSAAAIQPPTAFISTASRHSASSLQAKSASKNKSKSSGGFGKSTPKRKSKEPFTYPPLEPDVLQTLVPPPIDVNSNGGILSEEIYDRLEAIYGLEKFNFGGENSIYRSIGVSGADEQAAPAADPGGSLFDDLLKTEKDDDTLDNLFGSASPATQINTHPTASYDLNNLKPFNKFRVLHTDPMT